MDDRTFTKLKNSNFNVAPNFCPNAVPTDFGWVNPDNGMLVLASNGLKTRIREFETEVARRQNEKSEKEAQKQDETKSETKEQKVEDTKVSEPVQPKAAAKKPTTRKKPAAKRRVKKDTSK